MMSEDMHGIAGQSFLITGGFSLIGSHIAEKLLEADAARVLLLDNGAIGSVATIEALTTDARVRVITADILRIDAVLEALEGVHGVFHTASFITLPLSRNLWTGMDVNVRGLMNVLEACRWQRVRRIVYSSSVAAFGDPTDAVVDERAGFVPGEMKPAAALYGVGKVMGEQMCALYQQRHGIGCISLRYSTVYGERQHQRGMYVLALIAAYDSVRRNERPVIEGDGSDLHDYVYAGDVARANLLAMQSSLACETYTIATGAGTSTERVVRAVIRACGSSLEPEFSRPARDGVATYASAPRFDIGKAARDLNWRPQVPLEEGIARLVRWLNAQRH